MNYNELVNRVCELSNEIKKRQHAIDFLQEQIYPLLKERDELNEQRLERDKVNMALPKKGDEKRRFKIETEQKLRRELKKIKRCKVIKEQTK